MRLVRLVRRTTTNFGCDSLWHGFLLVTVLSKFWHLERGGVRQGHPFAMYLFLIVGKVLNHMVNDQ